MKLLKVSSFAALLTLLRMVSGFVIAKVVATHTGPIGIAMLGQLQSLINSLAGVVSSPVGSGVVRYTAQNLQQGNAAIVPWWRAATKIVWGLLLIIVPLVCLLSHRISVWMFDTGEYSWLIVLVAFALPLTAVNSMLQSILNGLQRYRSYVFLGMISTSIATISMALIVLYKGLSGALACAAVFSAISGLVLLSGVIREPWLRLDNFFGAATAENFKGIGAYVSMALTSALVIPGALILVRNILVREVGWEQTGMWQAVWKISEVYLAVVTMSLGTYYLPRLSSLTRYSEIRREIWAVSKIILPLIACVALAIFLLRDWIVCLLFTTEFKPAREYFAVQLAGDIVKIASWLIAYPMLSKGASSWFIATEILFGFTFVMLSWLLIPSMGVHGANLSYLLTYSICFLFVSKNLRKFARDT